MANLTDRCDGTASGAEDATTWWVLPGGGDLKLCDHHSHQHTERLTAEGWVTQK